MLANTRRARRAYRRFALCVMGAGFLLMLMCGTAWATNYFDGIRSAAGQTAYTGCRSNIYNYVPRYGSSGTAFSCAWPMVCNTGAADGAHALAQIGWVRGRWSGHSDNGVYYFYEYENFSGGVQGIQILSAVPNPLSYGTLHTYTVQFDGTSSISYRIDGVEQVYGSSNWQPDRCQVAAEVYTETDQVAGDTAHKCYFGSPSRYTNGAWELFPPTSGRRWVTATTNGKWEIDPNDANRFATWDKRYSTEGGF